MTEFNRRLFRASSQMDGDSDALPSYRPTPTRDRSASQPPRPFISTSISSQPRHFAPSSYGSSSGTGSSWMQSSSYGGLNPNSSYVNRSPTYSPPFSFSSRFPTTPEDEFEPHDIFSHGNDYEFDYDGKDEYRTGTGLSSSLSRAHGRGYAAQASASQSFDDSYLSQPRHGLRAMDIHPYGDITPKPASSSNMSPFSRDIGKVLLDERSSLWQNLGYGDNGGSGSGSSSRRHSVSVMRAVGFNAPRAEHVDSRSSRGGLMLTDEDLLGSLSIDDFSPRYPSYRDREETLRARQPPPTSPTARYVPGQGIQYFDTDPPLSPQRAPTTPTSALPTPISAPTIRRPTGTGPPANANPSSDFVLVSFKRGRTEVFHAPPEWRDELGPGDAVIVEGDRGKDLGTVVRTDVDPMASHGEGADSPTNCKLVYAKASAKDVQSLASKSVDEAKALGLCRAKVLAKGLPMEVRDAEYQWDRRKLTFYYVPETKGRIDFRELVKELFRLYKTRIWMESLVDREEEGVAIGAD